MITDSLLRVSAEQAVTTTAVSTNTVDLSVARDMGEGNDLYMNFAVSTTFSGGTSITFEIIIADDAALSSNVTVIGASGAVLTAALGAGTNIAVRFNPLIGSNGKRYLGARYTVSGTYSAGKVIADVVETIQDGKKYYASGFAVV
jgi:hypothetical protein